MNRHSPQFEYMSLDDFERYPLTFGPSPVHPLDRLTAHLGQAQLHVRRARFLPVVPDSCSRLLIWLFRRSHSRGG